LKTLRIYRADPDVKQMAKALMALRLKMAEEQSKDMSKPSVS
jgi:hypothetical protein